MKVTPLLFCHSEGRSLARRIPKLSHARCSRSTRNAFSECCVGLKKPGAALNVRCSAETIRHGQQCRRVAFTTSRPCSLQASWGFFGPKDGPPNEQPRYYDNALLDLTVCGCFITSLNPLQSGLAAQNDRGWVCWWIENESGIRFKHSQLS